MECLGLTTMVTKKEPLFSSRKLAVGASQPKVRAPKTKLSISSVKWRGIPPVMRLDAICREKCKTLHFRSIALAKFCTDKSFPVYLQPLQHILYTVGLYMISTTGCLNNPLNACRADCGII